MPYPSVPAESDEVAAEEAFAEPMVYAGEVVAKPAFASLRLNAQPAPSLQEIVDETNSGVVVATLLDERVPNANVEVETALHVMVWLTVAVTFTVIAPTIMAESKRVLRPNNVPPAKTAP